MAQRSTQSGGTSRRRQPGAPGRQAAYERLTASVEAAQPALKDLRGELGRGSRELLRVELTLRDARKDLRRVSRQLVKELEGVQPAAAGKRATGQASKATRGPEPVNDEPDCEPGEDDGGQAQQRQASVSPAAPGPERSVATRSRRPTAVRRPAVRVAAELPPELPPLEPEGPPDEEPEPEPEPDEPLEPAPLPEEEPVPV